MLYLFLVSLIWAFSFGLIKTGLASVDSNLVAAIRLGLALILFLPFFRSRAVDRSTAVRLVLIGAVQYGGMYVSYLYAFRFLKAYEVALYTVLTPLYVTLLSDVFQRKMHWVNLGAVGLAITGAWIVQGGEGWRWVSLTGFLAVQVSNLCFAFGQIYYRQVLAGRVISDRQVFALLYLGGLLVAGLSAGVFTRWNAVNISTVQWLYLLYLGVIASGLCFFLWNVGARQVEAGTLAIFNDFKFPLAVAVSLVVFGERANLFNLAAAGGLITLALVINHWGAGRFSSSRTARALPAPSNE